MKLSDRDMKMGVAMAFVVTLFSLLGAGVVAALLTLYSFYVYQFMAIQSSVDGPYVASPFFTAIFETFRESFLQDWIIGVDYSERMLLGSALATP